MDYSALLDGFALCEKRTANTLKATHEFGSYLGKFAQSVKDGTKGITVIKQYSTKKLLTNAGLDYTLKTSVDSAIAELEDFLNNHATFSNQISEISTSIEQFFKEQELARKKLVDSAHRLEREYNNQLDILKKSKDKYYKLGQELDAITTQIEKVRGQMNVQKLVQLTSKQAKALDTFKQAETEYQSTLDETNKKKETYYNEEMPALLREFNAFEEGRLSFMRDKLIKLSDEILALPQKIEDSGNKIKNTANNINPTDDITNFVTSNQTSPSLAPLQPEPYTPIWSGEKNDSTKDSTREQSSTKPQNSLSSSSSVATPAPSAAPSAAPSNTTNPQMSSNDNNSAPPMRAQPSIPMIGMVPQTSSSTAPHRPQPQPPRQNTTSPSIPSSPPSSSSSPSSSPSSSTSSFPPPSAPPRPSRGAPHHQAGPARPPPRRTDAAGTRGNGAVAQRPPAARPAMTRAVPSEQQQQQQIVETNDDDQENEYAEIDQTPLFQKKGLFDYAARSETELGFAKDEVLDILKQNDSGWWLAKIGDKTGYVPMNYLTDV